jgi:hypothetical protein
MFIKRQKHYINIVCEFRLCDASISAIAQFTNYMSKSFKGVDNIFTDLQYFTKGYKLVYSIQYTTKYIFKDRYKYLKELSDLSDWVSMYDDNTNSSVKEDNFYLYRYHYTHT